MPFSTKTFVALVALALSAQAAPTVIERDGPLVNIHPFVGPLVGPKILKRAEAKILNVAPIVVPQIVPEILQHKRDGPVAAIQPLVAPLVGPKVLKRAEAKVVNVQPFVVPMVVPEILQHKREEVADLHPTANAEAAPQVAKRDGPVANIQPFVGPFIGPKILRRDATTDAAVLNFALTLEHLEATYYKQGLARFSQADFDKAGLPWFTRGRVQQIGAHEATHVEFLTTAIAAAGAKPVAQCEYQFPINNARDFMTLSRALETVGTAAYTGAAQFIENKAYLTAAATILTVEARHAGWVSSAGLAENAWGTAFDIPLTVNQVYTLASQFIKSCPDSNNPSLAPLALKASTPVSIPASARPGQQTQLSFDAAGKNPRDLYAAFLTGTGPVFAKIDGDKKVVVPKGLLGASFVVITTDNKGVTDQNTVAGPGIMNFAFDSRGNYE